MTKFFFFLALFLLISIQLIASLSVTEKNEISKALQSKRKDKIGGTLGCEICFDVANTVLEALLEVIGGGSIFAGCVEIKVL